MSICHTRNLQLPLVLFCIFPTVLSAISRANARQPELRRDMQQQILTGAQLRLQDWGQIQQTHLRFRTKGAAYIIVVM